jgi:hypothetical protein
MLLWSSYPSTSWTPRCNTRFCWTIRFRGLASAANAPDVLYEGGNIMVRRHELTDEQFAILEPHLPPSGTVGHP